MDDKEKIQMAIIIFEKDNKEIGTIIDDRSMNRIPFGTYVDEFERNQLAITALKQMQGWISVKDELPNKKGEYLVAYHPCHWDRVQEEIIVGTDSFRGKSTWAKHKFQRVTHWMPMPKSPEDKENG